MQEGLPRIDLHSDPANPLTCTSSKQITNMIITKIHENKITSTGKPQQIVSIDDNPQQLTYWGNDLEEGQTFNGEIVPPSDPKYKPSLRAVKTASRTSNFTSRTSTIEKAVKDKATNIQVAQERKNGSIEEAANWRDAVMIVNTLLANKVLVDGIDLLNHNELDTVVKNSIISWKNWFAEKKDPNSNPPF